jgi:hypothetical protein
MNYLNTILKIFFLILIILELLFHKKKLIIIFKSIKEIKEINLNKFFELKDKTKDPNDLLIVKEKESFLNFLSNLSEHKITSVDTIFLTQNYKFGNMIIILNKVLFYCEIIKCKKIVLDQNKTWYIKNKIVNPEYNISIEIGDPKKYNSRNIIFDTSDNFLYYYAYIKPEFRAYFLRNEILQFPF